jgi:hypothetical protein
MTDGGCPCVSCQHRYSCFIRVYDVKIPVSKQDRFPVMLFPYRGASVEQQPERISRLDNIMQFGETFY